MSPTFFLGVCGLLIIGSGKVCMPLRVPLRYLKLHLDVLRCAGGTKTSHTVRRVGLFERRVDRAVGPSGEGYENVTDNLDLPRVATCGSRFAGPSVRVVCASFAVPSWPSGVGVGARLTVPIDRFMGPPGEGYVNVMYSSGYEKVVCVVPILFWVLANGVLHQPPGPPRSGSNDRNNCHCPIQKEWLNFAGYAWSTSHHIPSDHVSLFSWRTTAMMPCAVTFYAGFLVFVPFPDFYGVPRCQTVKLIDIILDAKSLFDFQMHSSEPSRTTQFGWTPGQTFSENRLRLAEHISLNPNLLSGRTRPIIQSLV